MGGGGGCSRFPLSLFCHLQVSPSLFFYFRFSTSLFFYFFGTSDFDTQNTFFLHKYSKTLKGNPRLSPLCVFAPMDAEDRGMGVLQRTSLPQVSIRSWARGLCHSLLVVPGLRTLLVTNIDHGSSL